jgi:HKD family nuclease
MAQLIVQPHGDLRLGDFLNQHLQEPEWTAFKAAVAFVKYSGARQIEQNLSDFSRRGQIKLAVGVDCQGTSAEGLTALMNAVGDRGEIWVFHNETEATFHPKVYAFAGAARADVIVGSGNLTAGGLYTNYEASLA